MTDRNQMPQEFYDRTSSQLLLKPEPQYLYAEMMLKALSADLPIPEEMGHPGRMLSGVGADYSNEGGNYMIEPDGISEKIFAGEVDFVGEPGHTVRFNRPLFRDTTYTIASRTVAQGKTISTTPIKVGSEQTSLTLQRFAGPYDPDASDIGPLGLDNLDTQVGIHKASKIAGMHLSRDFHKFLDGVGTTLLDQGTAVYPDGITADNDFTSVRPLDYAFMSKVERIMDDANLPVLPDGKRMWVMAPAGAEAMKLDRQYTLLSMVHPKLNALFPTTYLTSVGKFHVFQSTTLSKPSNTSSIPVYRAHAIAPGALGVGMGKKPTIAFSNDDNYGITAKIIWMAFMAFGLFDSSFIYTPRFTSISGT